MRLIHKLFGEPKVVQQTLDWCNDMRALKGQEPLNQLPKGIPLDPQSCPCGAATGLRVTYGRWTNEDFTTHGRVPKYVDDFMHRFDSHRLPQYIAERMV